MSRGEGRDQQRPATPLYAEFAQRVRQVEAEAHARTVEVVYRAASAGDWRAALAMLRLRWARHYAEQPGVGGPEGRALQQVHAQVTVQQVQPWVPDKPFARQVIELLIAAGKLPAGIDVDAAAGLVTTPTDEVAPADASGSAGATDEQEIEPCGLAEPREG